MAERQEISRIERRRAPKAAPPPIGRPGAANDNIPPVRHLVGKLAIATASFAATFVFAWWWLG